MPTMQSIVQFTPASGEDVTVIAPVHGAVFALPAVDSANTALTVTNAGPAAVAVNFGTAATVPAQPNMPGLFTVQPSTTALVDGPLAAVVGTATYIAVAPSPGGAILTLQRGTATTLTLALPSAA